MVAPTQLDQFLANDRKDGPCLRERILLKYPNIKRIFSPLFSLAEWVMGLFNPPPLEAMNLRQKTGRVLLMTAALVIASILFAMLGAVGLFIMEKGRELRDAPEFYNGLVIVLLGVAVNAACIFALLQIKKADTKLVPPGKK
jgi:hypothetical protein